METKQEKLEDQRDRIIRQANEEAHAVLREAKEYADQTMKMFHKFQKDHVDLAAVEKERQDLRKRMNKAEKGMTQKTAVQKPKKELTAKDISLGDAVKVLSMNLKGTVSSRPDSKGNLFVQMGIIRSKVKLSDLELIDEGKLSFEQLYDQDNKVTVGERIVTSNISEKYVEGLFIGYVSEIQQDPNNLTKTGTIVTPVDFGHLKDVFVITVNKQDAIDKTEDASNEK